MIAVSAISMFSCAVSSTTNEENLPQDVALRPKHDHSEYEKNGSIKNQASTSVQQIQNELVSSKKEIDSLIATQTCDNPENWALAEFGAKPCGGPTSYLPYPKILEENLLEKINHYNQLSKDYNKAKGLVSDCALIAKPMAIICKDGKAFASFDSAN